MNKKSIFIMLCSFVSIFSVKSQNEVQKLVVYKSFWRGGTTTMVLSLFKETEKYSIDTTNINNGTDLFLKEFGLILSKSKQRKHFQQKIAGIDIAGEFWLNQSENHYFIICLPNRLIDMTNKKEYIISDDLLLTQMHYWIKKINQ